eukprot:6134616-Pyramimonas_sp.AAC.1
MGMPPWGRSDCLGVVAFLVCLSRVPGICVAGLGRLLGTWRHGDPRPWCPPTRVAGGPCRRSRA